MIACTTHNSNAVGDKTKTKECVACMGRIPITANKCSNCGSFQNFRRFLDIGNSSLSLLIALASISTLLVSIIINHLITKEFKIYPEVFGSRTDQISISYYNVGKLPGALPDFVSVYVEGRTGISDSYNMSYRISKKNISDLIINPGNAKIVTYDLTERTIKRPFIVWSSSLFRTVGRKPNLSAPWIFKCKVSIDIQTAGKESDWIRLPTVCHDMTISYEVWRDDQASKAGFN